MNEVRLYSEEVIIHRSEANFDKACELAYFHALKLFKVDEYGHSTLEGWERNCCSIDVEFVKYIGNINNHNYFFNAFVTKSIEDD